MAICLTISNVKVLQTGVWRAKLAPEDLYFFEGGATRLGPLSVLLLSNAASFDRATNTLSISWTFARVLNLGNTDDAIIVESRAPSPGDIQNNFPMLATLTSGLSAHERPAKSLVHEM